MTQDLLKTILTRAGSHFSARTMHRLNAAISYIETGRWLNEQKLVPRVRVDRNRELFDLIIRDVADREVLYLEFGVFRGDSMRYWSRRLKHPHAKLHGFDSFEGLPEAWNIDSPQGHFSTNGAIPIIKDPRVKFFKGWFNDTLPGYQMPPHNRLVLDMDADLYSSTIYVLKTLESFIVPGTYIYFDEFADRENELRAFSEFVLDTEMRFELTAAKRDNSKVVFRRVG
jgi:Macrocin-O-methyltransferase (TylF)